MKESIALVVDSTIDLGKPYTEFSFVRIVPLNVTFPDGRVIYDDGTMDIRDFYVEMGKYPTLPLTSQPSPQQFLDTYQELLPNYEDIISFHVSSVLSGTYNSAVLARHMLPEEDQKRVHMVDSKTVSTCFGLSYLAAADAIAAKKSFAEVMAEIEVDIATRTCFVSLRTMENLRKSGRVNHLSAFFGGILKIKPILEIGCRTGGNLIALTKVRGRKRAISRMLQEAITRAPNISEQRIGIMDSIVDDVEELNHYVDEVKRSLKPREIVRSMIGPTVGTHAGVGAFAIIFNEELGFQK